MIHRILGTINKRIDVGIDTSNNHVFIHSSSNCISFTREEFDCLISVLNVLSWNDIDYAEHVFSYKHIDLFEPKTPPAEVKL